MGEQPLEKPKELVLQSIADLPALACMGPCMRRARCVCSVFRDPRKQKRWETPQLHLVLVQQPEAPFGARIGCANSEKDPGFNEQAEMRVLELRKNSGMSMRDIAQTTAKSKPDG